jgi:predicted SprT family Zn-dependent metalloprotease
MNLFEAQMIAERLMQENGLFSYKFKFDRAKRRFGSCNYVKKVITISQELTALNEQAEVVDVILHEIAHALTKQGHTEVFYAKCRELGCRPERCYNSEKVMAPQGKYKYKCINCGHVYSFHRQKEGLFSCGKCNPMRKFDKSKLCRRIFEGTENKQNNEAEKYLFSLQN